jgi:hypothetical protein
MEGTESDTGAGVETSTEVSTPPVTETTEVVDTGAGAGVGAQTDVAEASAGMVDEASPDTSTPVEWNGELESLESSEWFKEHVPEQFRQVLSEGMKRKYRNIEAGLTKAAQRYSEESKELQTKVSGLESEISRYRRWLDTGEDLGTQAFKEADELRKQVESLSTEKQTEIARLQGEIEAAKEALRQELEGEFKGKLTPVEEERERLRQELEETRRLAAEAEAARNQEVLDALVNWVEEAAPALWDDDNADALALFTSLLENGIADDPGEALTLVGAKFPLFSTNRPEPVPDEIALMSDDSGSLVDPIVGSEPEDYSSIKKRMWSEAAQNRW